MLQIPALLPAQQVLHWRQALRSVQWNEGSLTAGDLARSAKHNQQLGPEHPLTQQIGDAILAALGRNATFMAAALPLKVFPPRINRYADGGHYGDHIDGSVLSVAGTPHRIRTDLSATVFLSEPTEYEGGELVVQDTFGSHTVKLPAGHMVLYPGNRLHQVRPVLRGERVAAFFWVQSLVRDLEQRRMLYELDQSIQALRGLPDAAEQVQQLFGLYHNLVRQWSQT